jgi:hypothetical protein
MATTETIPVSRPAPPPEQQLMQMASGFAFTAALYSIAKLKIADLLADGPLPVSRLSQITGSNADALYRVLRLLASAGVFAESAGTESANTDSVNKVFALTPVSEFLRAGKPGSMRDTVLWLGNRFHAKVWSELSYSVQTGKPAVEHVYGKPCFDAIFGDPEIAFDFNTAMTCFSRKIAPALLEVYDFSGIGTLMDVAGGHGAVLCEVLSRYPGMKGILFDMPNVIAEATGHISSLNMDHRCNTMTGDFFEQIPTGADAYYMQHILHDWADEPALKILANCRRALEDRKEEGAKEKGRKEAGRLVIVDTVVPETPEPHFSKLLDLEMLLMPGGRERTEREWRDLFSNAGFEITRIVPIRAAESVIEARVRP